MNQHREVMIRSWKLTGDTALEDMVIGLDEEAVCDEKNILSSDEFDACLAIVFCCIGSNTFAHLSQIAGFYKGDESKIWELSRRLGVINGITYQAKPITRIHCIPHSLIQLDDDHLISVSSRVAIMHFLLDMG